MNVKRRARTHAHRESVCVCVCKDRVSAVWVTLKSYNSCEKARRMREKKKRKKKAQWVGENAQAGRLHWKFCSTHSHSDRCTGVNHQLTKRNQVSVDVVHWRERERERMALAYAQVSWIQMSRLERHEFLFHFTFSNAFLHLSSFFVCSEIEVKE